MAPSAGLERRWLGEARARGGIPDRELSRFRIAPVAGREPARYFRRHVKPRIGHAERLETPLALETAEAHSAGSLDQHARDVHAGMIEPALARLVHEGKRAEPAHELI